MKLLISSLQYLSVCPSLLERDLKILQVLYSWNCCLHDVVIFHESQNHPQSPSKLDIKVVSITACGDFSLLVSVVLTFQISVYG